MALLIEIPLEGRNWIVTYNGNHYDVREEGEKKPLASYPTSMSRVLAIIVKETLGNKGSNELITIQGYVDRIESIYEALRALPLPQHLEESPRGSNIVEETESKPEEEKKERKPRVAKPKAEPVIEKPNPFGAF